MIKKLECISRALEKESEEIKEKLEKYKSDIFVVYTYGLKENEENGNYELSNETNNASMVDFKNKKGIYVFCSPNSIECFDNEFDDIKYAAKINSNINNADSIKKIMYLGKSYDLSKRLQEHFSSADALPYSLKCSHTYRKEYFKNVKILIFVLSEKYEQHKEVILSTVEAYLHEKCLPIIGSKRI